MLNNIEIINFRSFESTIVRKLRRLNLVTGKNGSGKTSLLEAIVLNCGAANAGVIFSVNTHRGEVAYNAEVDTSFRSLFHNLRSKSPIQINAEEKTQKSGRIRSLRIDAMLKPRMMGVAQGRPLVAGLSFSFKKANSPEAKGHVLFNFPPPQAGPPGQQFTNTQPPVEIVNPPISSDGIIASYISPYAQNIQQDVYNKVVAATKNKQISRVVERLLPLQPDIKNIIPIMDFGQPNIFVDIGLDELLPISVLGSGFMHILRIALDIASSSSSVIIIDELEDGIHYSIIPRIAEMIISCIKESDIQFFISTHSSELIEAFVKTSQRLNFDDICLINVVPGKKQMHTRYFDASELDFALEVDAELR